MSGSAQQVAAALAAHDAFVLTSHARPDGDAVGSALALALALQALGKRTTVVLHDPVPEPYRTFPAVDQVIVADRASDGAAVAVFLECGDPSRAEVSGLDRTVVVNIDHHLGNRLFGTVNWFDASAAACGELVAAVIDELGVAWTPAIATHLYLAIATDTGSFRYGPVSAGTFETCRRIVTAGVDTSALSRQIFDSYSIGRVRLTGILLEAMTLHHASRVAVLAYDDALLARAGATADDTEGLVNLPLSARGVVAVILIKQQGERQFRISLRSKGTVDVRAVAARFGGGGHTNAAGCSLEGPLDHVRATLVNAVGTLLEP